MPEAVTPPNPAGGGGTGGQQISGGSRNTGAPPESNPDPTLLTIDSIRREIATVVDLSDIRLDAARDLTTAHLHRLESLMDRAERQRREQKVDTAVAVDRALSAQKELVDSLRRNFETEVAALSGVQADLKDRMTQIESRRDERRRASAALIAAVGLGVAILMTLATIAAFIAGGG